VRCGAALALLAVLTLGAAQADDASVTVARLAGDVKVMNKTETKGQWVDAEAKQQLSAGWSLRTGEESKAQLVFPKDNVVILKENSVLVIHELGNGGAAHIESTDGGLLVQLKHHLDPGAEFTLDTPDAQAIVRGTEYGVQIEDAGTDSSGNPQAKSTFYGYEGTVEVKNDKGTQLLKKGNTLVAELGQIPGVPVASAQAALDFFNDLNSDKLFKEAEQKAKDKVNKQINKKLKGLHL
jgi:hypothetical protein